MLVFLHRSLSRWRSDEGGLTLIEILAALFILSIAILSLAAAAATSIRSVRVSRDRQQATQLATTTLEDVRALAFQDIVLDAAGSPPASFEGETVVAGAGGSVDHVQDLSPHTVTTFVTYTDNVDQTQKRVTALVSWTDGGTERTVRQETLVAEATRGLDAPSFVVSQPNPEPGPLGETICFDHTLNNTGDQDSYSWKLFATDATTLDLIGGNREVRTVREPDGTGHVEVVREGFRVPSNAEGSGWFGWARLDTPSGGEVEPMVESTGDDRPDSVDQIPALSSALLVICYTPLNQSGVLTGQTKSDRTATFTPRIYSAFDETVTTESQNNEITNTVQVEDANTPLYLHHDATASTLPMDTTPPANSAPEDYDGDLVDGVGLAANGESVEWAYQFPEASQVEGTPILTFWTRAESALGDPWDLVYDFRLEIACTVASDNGCTGNGDLVTLADVQNVVIGDVTEAWQQVSVAVPLDAPVNFSQNDSLRLVVACDETSETDCHIDYDVDDGTTIRNSRLAVTVN